jgi:predicted small lipoprotein YifL
MHCWARYLLIAVVSVLGIGQMIAACGQKGDLYLPEKEEAPTQAGPPARADSAPAPETGEALETAEDIEQVSEAPAPGTD